MYGFAATGVRVALWRTAICAALRWRDRKNADKVAICDAFPLVLAVEPNKTLTYSWAAHDLKSVVTWTLTPTSTGTHLRMEQSGFRRDQPQYYQGAQCGWQRFFANLEQVLARID